jgi:hypothetical protein
LSSNLTTASYKAPNGNTYDLEFLKNSDGIAITVSLEDDIFIAGARFRENTDGTWSAADLNTNIKHRRQGIASAIYSFMEALGYKIISSDEANFRGVGEYAGQTDAGVAFFEKRKRFRR